MQGNKIYIIQNMVSYYLSNLHEFINIHMNYMDENNHKLKTKTIFINCLLNHIMIFES